MDGSIERLEEDVKKKADRELLQTHLDYISGQIQDLKDMVTEMHAEQ
jgi:nitrogen fixation/metabolism regulation signal transduction histidine kinase